MNRRRFLQEFSNGAVIEYPAKKGPYPQLILRWLTLANKKSPLAGQSNHGKIISILAFLHPRHLYKRNQGNQILHRIFALQKQKISKERRLNKRRSLSRSLSIPFSFISFSRLIFLFSQRKWGSAFRSTSARPVFRSAMPAGNFTVLSTGFRWIFYLFAW